MTDKEKINNLTTYLLFADTRFKNVIIEKENQMRLKPDTYNVMEYYKACNRYEAYKDISSDINKIIFDIEV